MISFCKPPLVVSLSVIAILLTTVNRPLAIWGPDQWQENIGLLLEFCVSIEVSSIAAPTLIDSEEDLLIGNS